MINYRSMEIEDLDEISRLFKLLGHPKRLQLLYLLIQHSMSVSEISKALNWEQSAVSHQLRILRDARLVQFRRDGKVVYYSLADNHVFTLLAVGLEHVAE